MDLSALNWSVVEAIAESAAAIGVVISLLYVARQMQHSNRISRAEAYRAIWLKNIDLQLGWASDPGFRRVLPKIYTEHLRWEDLEPAERTLAALYMNAFLNMRALLHQEIGQGILPSSAREHFGASTVRLPYMRDLWDVVREDYPADFRAHFEALLADAARNAGRASRDARATRPPWAPPERPQPLFDDLELAGTEERASGWEWLGEEAAKEPSLP